LGRYCGFPGIPWSITSSARPRHSSRNPLGAASSQTQFARVEVAPIAVCLHRAVQSSQTLDDGDGHGIRSKILAIRPDIARVEAVRRWHRSPASAGSIVDRATGCCHRSVMGFQAIQKIATIYAGPGVIRGIPTDRIPLQLELAVLTPEPFELLPTAKRPASADWRKPPWPPNRRSSAPSASGCAAPVNLIYSNARRRTL
jgi:hypothetical protein